MSKATIAAFVCALFVGLVAANTAASRPNPSGISTTPLLHTLAAFMQLEMRPLESRFPGGPRELEITDETIERLTKAKEEGKIIYIYDNGTIEFAKK